MKMNIKEEQFVQFCQMYEEANHFDTQVTKDDLVETLEGCYYSATFRDEYNYKINVLILLENGEIKVQLPTFFDDEESDTKPFFASLAEEVHQNFLNEIGKEP